MFLKLELSRTTNKMYRLNRTAKFLKVFVRFDQILYIFFEKLLASGDFVPQIPSGLRPGPAGGLPSPRTPEFAPPLVCCFCRYCCSESTSVSQLAVRCGWAVSHLIEDFRHMWNASISSPGEVRFPGQAQQPSDSRCLRFLWQLGKGCRLSVHRTWWLCWPLPGSPLHLPLWQCRQWVILYKCLGQWHVTSQAIGLPQDHRSIVLCVSHFADSNSPVPLLPESAHVSQLSTEYHSCAVS